MLLYLMVYAGILYGVLCYGVCDRVASYMI